MDHTGSQMKARATGKGTMRAVVHRLHPALRDEWRAAFERLSADGSLAPAEAARAEMIERFGADAYRDENLGVISGGRWWARWLGKWRTHRSNRRVLKALEAELKGERA